MSFTDKEISDRIEFNNELLNKIQAKIDLSENKKTKQCIIHSVVKPSYCADESYHKIDRCKNQCGGCKEIQSCFKQ